MKDRPIIFSGEMVRAILDGRKTMTRRVAKVYETSPGMISPVGCHCPRKPENHVPYCPHGQPGDRLWVKETLEKHRLTGVTLPDGRKIPGGSFAFYRADGEQCLVGGAGINEGIEWRWEKDVLSSIFMPRFASRITLEITDVRVERVQEIRLLDIKAEGITDAALGNVIQEGFTVQKAFEDLWDSIYGKKPGWSWADNPWVWVISFKRVGG